MATNPSGRFLGSEYPPVGAAEAGAHILPVPYEETVSYGAGTAGGPAAIIEASDQLERFDGVDEPGAIGIYTAPDVDTRGDSPDVFARITQAVRGVLDYGALPIVLGGEHAITAPAVAGVLAASDRPLGVVQIDAHADLRDRYEGRSDSHACVMRRIHADLGCPLLQLGVRALSVEEEHYRRAAASTERPTVGDLPPLIAWSDAPELVRGAVRHVEVPAPFPHDVWFTVDVDGLDPSIMPSTGTPVPGGLGWYQTLDLVAAIAEQRRIVGFDVVEFAPHPALHGPAYLVAELVWRILGIVTRAAARRSGA